MATGEAYLASLQTESRNPSSTNIDRVSTKELCQIINAEDASIAQVVEGCIDAISGAIDALAEKVRRGGRVIYIGAGTSGRLGVLDASEIPPTYSAPPEQFVALIAGGDDALRNAKEGAEDDEDAAVDDLRKLAMDPEVDSLIGIASSGRTPYVLGGLRYAKSLGCTTVGIACAEPSAMASEGNVDFMISAVTGPEVVTGSTRMKAGTATKMVLNMISTGVMIRVGKTYGNMMVDLKATNIKLKQRAKNLLRLIGGPLCPDSDEGLEALLEECDGSVKLAAAKTVLQKPVAEVRERLAHSGGVLANLIRDAEVSSPATEEPPKVEDSVVLCIDAGGSSCKAVILSRQGQIGRGESGPCNVLSAGVESAMSTMSVAVRQATESFPALRAKSLDQLPISKAWVAMAGYDRPSIAGKVDEAVRRTLGLPTEDGLLATSDIDLLTAAVASQSLIESAIVLVAGTGSIAMSYQRQGSGFVRTGRTGGWGHLLGDDGSGYGLGREGLRVALEACDRRRLQKRSRKSLSPLSPLSQAITDLLATWHPDSQGDDLLSTILMPDAEKHKGEDMTSVTTKRIADVSKVVMACSEDDQIARSIVDRGARSLVRLVTSLLNEQDMEPAGTALIVAGGLMQNETYRQTVLKSLRADGINFSLVQPVDQQAVAGAEFLMRDLCGPK
ncbi:N-acetylmuramic acid 6-phosphate etherase [Pleurostoma richardsiae]|uniref:N-acetyl-D-glucosamine kinase n=1 Tax=Pleurostoma richardsiae TaxID=41990 RepID=A0AA38R4I8_9PEZI|nr:N-acetylmuramic acid 6-phosphate etherase [Pleurostoma richardsiae]